MLKPLKLVRTVYPNLGMGMGIIIIMGMDKVEMEVEADIIRVDLTLLKIELGGIHLRILPSLEEVVREEVGATTTTTISISTKRHCILNWRNFNNNILLLFNKLDRGELPPTLNKPRGRGRCTVV